MLKGFLHFEEPDSSSLLVLSASSCADTSSTTASLVTSSTPSLAEGLLFRKSWTVPCSLNFFNSLVKDCHRLGGGALICPQVRAGHLTMIIQSKKQNVGDYLRAYLAWIWAKSAPWILFYSKNALWALVHSPPLTHWNFLNLSKLCQTLAEPVIFLPWVEPDPNLELLGRNQ